MKIEEEILVNKYGQGLTSIDQLLTLFDSFSVTDKKEFLISILDLIIQSRPIDLDIELAIEQSKLRPTYTSCILLKKGVASHNLLRILKLPENEWSKTFVLFLSLFKIAYYRRFTEERNNSSKWWYSDLSDDKKVEDIIKEFKT